jgi:hypothetical protein
MPPKPVIVERKRPPSRLRQITLHVARCPTFPEGSQDHGYSFVAPLTSAGKLDPVLWRKQRARCRAVRFWAGSPVRVGMLIHRAGGAGGSTWLLDFDASRRDDDEAGYRFELHQFTPGEYVTLSDEKDSFAFRIASVEDAPETGASQPRLEAVAQS